MRRYPAGTRVRGGLYVDLEGGRTVLIPRRGGVLRGHGTSYARLPLALPLAFLLAPVAGAIFVVVLPFIGLGLLVGMLCRKVWVATGLGEALSALFAAGHGRPGWAFLLGGRRTQGDGGRMAPPAAPGPAAAAREQDEKKEAA